MCRRWNCWRIAPLWSLIFFAGVLRVQRRLHLIPAAMAQPRQAAMIALAAFSISVNWFLFIYATQVDAVAEASLGYFLFPLIAVLIGRVGFGERLSLGQSLAVALGAGAILVLTLGLGVAPWIALCLSTTFGIYSTIKKRLPLGPVVSVSCEVLMFLPFALVVLGQVHGAGQGVFGTNMRDSVLLMVSGPITALPLILFSAAARRVAMSTIGVLQYINPILQFLLAVALFGEPFGLWHALAFPMIWLALALYSIGLWRQDKAARKAAIVSSGVSATVRNAASEASAKP